MIQLENWQNYSDCLPDVMDGKLIRLQRCLSTREDKANYTSGIPSGIEDKLCLPLKPNTVPVQMADKQ